MKKITVPSITMSGIGMLSRNFIKPTSLKNAPFFIHLVHVIFNLKSMRLQTWPSL